MAEIFCDSKSSLTPLVALNAAAINGSLEEIDDSYELVGRQRRSDASQAFSLFDDSAFNHGSRPEFPRSSPFGSEQDARSGLADEGDACDPYYESTEAPFSRGSNDALALRSLLKLVLAGSNSPALFGGDAAGMASMQRSYIQIIRGFVTQLAFPCKEGTGNNNGGFARECLEEYVRYLMDAISACSERISLCKSDAFVDVWAEAFDALMETLNATIAQSKPFLPVSTVLKIFSLVHFDKHVQGALSVPRIADHINRLHERRIPGEAEAGNGHAALASRCPDKRSGCVLAELSLGPGRSAVGLIASREGCVAALGTFGICTVDIGAARDGSGTRTKQQQQPPPSKADLSPGSVFLFSRDGEHIFLLTPDSDGGGALSAVVFYTKTLEVCATFPEVKTQYWNVVAAAGPGRVVAQSCCDGGGDGNDTVHLCECSYAQETRSFTLCELRAYKARIDADPKSEASLFSLEDTRFVATRREARSPESGAPRALCYDSAIDSVIEGSVTEQNTLVVELLPLPAASTARGKRATGRAPGGCDPAKELEDTFWSMVECRSKANAARQCAFPGLAQALVSPEDYNAEVFGDLIRVVGRLLEEKKGDWMSSVRTCCQIMVPYALGAWPKHAGTLAKASDALFKVLPCIEDDETLLALYAMLGRMSSSVPGNVKRVGEIALENGHKASARHLRAFFSHAPTHGKSEHFGDLVDIAGKLLENGTEDDPQSLECARMLFQYVLSLAPSYDQGIGAVHTNFTRLFGSLRDRMKAGKGAGELAKAMDFACDLDFFYANILENLKGVLCKAPSVELSEDLVCLVDRLNKLIFDIHKAQEEWDCATKGTNGASITKTFHANNRSTRTIILFDPEGKKMIIQIKFLNQ